MVHMLLYTCIVYSYHRLVHMVLHTCIIQLPWYTRHCTPASYSYHGSATAQCHTCIVHSYHGTHATAHLHCTSTHIHTLNFLTTRLTNTRHKNYIYFFNAISTNHLLSLLPSLYIWTVRCQISIVLLHIVIIIRWKPQSVRASPPSHFTVYSTCPLHLSFFPRFLLTIDLLTHLSPTSSSDFLLPYHLPTLILYHPLHITPVYHPLHITPVCYGYWFITALCQDKSKKALQGKRSGRTHCRIITCHIAHSIEHNNLPHSSKH